MDLIIYMQKIFNKCTCYNHVYVIIDLKIIKKTYHKEL